MLLDTGDENGYSTFLCEIGTYRHEAIVQQAEQC
jgi:hypothetical protein